MLQKGYKRDAKGKAILHCFIGLFLVIIFVLLAYFYLSVDYTDKLDPDTSMRPYVEVTPSPAPSSAPESSVAPQTSPEATVEATASATPEPTPEPTPTPTPSPSPSPSPEPTSMASAAAPIKTDGFSLPSLTTMDVEMGITSGVRSSVDGNRYIQLKGYAYVNDPGYDGSTAAIYLVITQFSSNKSILVLPSKVDGASGMDHSDAACQNASASDFEVVIDAGSFPDEIYSLGMVFQYTDTNGQPHLEYAKFPEDITITTLGGQVMNNINPSEAE